jgi:hypothetical protein
VGGFWCRASFLCGLLEPVGRSLLAAGLGAPPADFLIAQANLFLHQMLQLVLELLLLKMWPAKK